MFKLSKNQKGFTLAETVVVISIFALLILLILSIYILTQKAYYLGDNKAEIDQNGRIVLDRMSREIRQAREIVTELPETDDNEDFPPANEIEFEDGHDILEINYIRYYLDGTDLRRQVIYYSFDEDPDFHVNWNVIDDQGEPPATSTPTEDKLVGEYMETLEFYEPDAINIYAKLTKNNYSIWLRTKIFGRNLR